MPSRGPHPARATGVGSGRCPRRRGLGVGTDAGDWDSRAAGAGPVGRGRVLVLSMARQ